ncbi:vesicle-associated protein 2-2-like [Oryza brachyantha]|uniref:MSP domain-containing protein n=1 Tax=Oryza brachyantha TaxID=4533 RepID=J3M6I8_ORYBR|nr:vesicle-associated protein 2-2-like [Oryza brachyantha]
MMGSEDSGLVAIHPGEIRFEFEVKKKSSCSVYLVNRSEEYVAFKVKTTSPKRYCVRPNVGVILPRATCAFTVIMQAQMTAPPDLQIKDKFLVQTTAVPFGTADEDISPAFFSKETGRYIEENKLRVVLVSATQLEQQFLAEVPSAMSGVEVPVAKETLNIVNEVPNMMDEVSHSLKTSFPPLREDPATLNEIPFPVKHTTILSPSKEVPVISAEGAHYWKETPAESLLSVNEVPHSLKINFPPLRENPATPNEIPFPIKQTSILATSKEVPSISADIAHHLKETSAVSVESHFSSTETNVASNEWPETLKDTSAPEEHGTLSGRLVNAKNLHHVTDDVQNLVAKLSNLEVKLEEAESVIIKLKEETRTTIRERDKLKQEMVLLTRKGASRSQAGFPLLFVGYMAILGVSLGYLLHL